MKTSPVSIDASYLSSDKFEGKIIKLDSIILDDLVSLRSPPVTVKFMNPTLETKHRSLRIENLPQGIIIIRTHLVPYDPSIQDYVPVLYEGKIPSPFRDNKVESKNGVIDTEINKDIFQYPPKPDAGKGKSFVVFFSIFHETRRLFSFAPYIPNTK